MADMRLLHHLIDIGRMDNSNLRNIIKKKEKREKK